MNSQSVIQVRDEIETTVERDTQSSSCSLSEQLVELSTIADFVACRSAQEPLHVIQPPELPKIITQPELPKEWLFELETLGEFLGVRRGETTTTIPTKSPSMAQRLLLNPAQSPFHRTNVIDKTPRTSNTVNSSAIRTTIVPITNEISTDVVTSPKEFLPDPPSNNTTNNHGFDHRYAAARDTANSNNNSTQRGVTTSGDGVYMCRVPQPSYSTIPAKEDSYYGSKTGNVGQHNTEFSFQEDDYNHEASSLAALPEEQEPLLAIVDEEESGRTSMIPVRDEDSSSISYYKQRPRKVPPPSRPATDRSHHQHHINTTNHATSLTRQRHHQQYNRNRISSNDVTRMQPSSSTRQRHSRHHQYHPSRKHQYVEDVSTTASSSHHPYRQHYSPVQETDTVRAVAPRKIAGHHDIYSNSGFASSTAPSSLDTRSPNNDSSNNKVMIVVVRRPQHNNNSNNSVDFG